MLDLTDYDLSFTVNLVDCSADFTFGAGPRVQIVSGSVVDQGGYSYQLTLDGIDSVMKFESIT